MKTNSGNKSDKKDKKSLDFSPQQLAIIAYLTPFGLIGAFLLNQKKKDQYASFHFKNMFGLIIFHAIGVSIGLNENIELANWIFKIGFAFYNLSIILWIISFIFVLSKKEKGAPFLDKYFAKWFKFLD